MYIKVRNISVINEPTRFWLVSHLNSRIIACKFEIQSTFVTWLSALRMLRKWSKFHSRNASRVHWVSVLEIYHGFGKTTEINYEEILNWIFLCENKKGLCARSSADGEISLKRTEVFSNVTHCIFHNYWLLLFDR